MKLHSGASVSCLRPYCQPFRTESTDALYTSGSHLVLLLIFPTDLLSSPAILTFSLYPSWVVELAPPSPFLCLSFSVPPSSLHLLFPLLLLPPRPALPLFSSHIVLTISTSGSLVFLSYKGLTADSDSKSTQWTNDTNTWGHHFTYSAQKAKLSVRPSPGASLHHCPNSADARAVGPLAPRSLCLDRLQKLTPSTAQAEDAFFQQRQTLAPTTILMNLTEAMTPPWFGERFSPLFSFSRFHVKPLCFSAGDCSGETEWTC